MDKQIRWKQRFQNFEKAFAQLDNALKIKNPSETERAGVIQFFEICFELAWKTLKDYLESKQVVVSFPRDVIKQAFHHQVITDGDTWMDMLEKRNELTHTYNEATAEKALQLIRNKYFTALKQVMEFLDQQNT